MKPFTNKKMIYKGKCLLCFLGCFMLSLVACNVRNNNTRDSTSFSQERITNGKGSSQSSMDTGIPLQLNCTSTPSICRTVCNEKKQLPYSSTFCEPSSGSCICDCRDRISKKCEKTPFTPCFQNCVRANPNPDVFLYKGGNCPIPQDNVTVSYQCACECTFRDDYDETNDIM